jgi:hypothetical protein
MANTIRVKRRAAGGAAGAPASLANAELAFNEQDNVLYYGTGTGGAGGSATQVIAIAGPGSFAQLASPTFTGTPAAPTAAVSTNTTQLATTAFVLGQGNSTAGTITMNGTQAAGSSNLYARADHVHASDTSRAPLASPTFTGTPAAPTATNGTNTTQLATTAYVLATRLDQFTAPTTAVSFNSQRLTSVADPTGAQDAATKAYVDNVAQGLDAKQSVKAATTANITNLLTGAPNTVDGVSLAVSDRVLVKSQSTASGNGIYTVTTVGTGANGVWARATDMDAWAEVPSAFVFVEQGTANADTSWVCSSDQGGTLGSTAINFFQFGSAAAYTAGNGLTLTGNSFSVVADGSTLAVSASGVKVSDTYPGNTSLVTLGTVTTGTWSASTIAVNRGGTGVTTLTGLVKGNGTSAFSAAVAGTDYHDTNSTIDGGTF